MRFISLTTALLLCSSTFALQENRDLFPLGEREGFMANTGVAVVGSTGAVYYNPAGLVTLPDGKISLSGNSYLKFKSQFKPVLVVDGANLDFTAEGTIAVPTTFVSSKDYGSFTGAFSVLVPEQSKLQDISRFETTNFTIDINQHESAQWLLIGYSVAKEFNFANLGVSCFYATYESTISSGITITPKGGSGFPNTGYNIIYENTKVNGLLCHLGAQKQINEKINLGVTIRSPLIELSNKGKSYTTTQDVNGVVSAPTYVDEDPHRDIPLMISTGGAYKFSGKWQVYLDLSLQLSNSFKRNKSDAFDTENKTIVRENLGVMYSHSDNLRFLGGFANNPGSSKIKVGGDTSEDYRVFSLGAEWDQGQASMGIGLYHAISSGDIRLQNGGNGSLKTTATAIVLTSGFTY